MIDKALESLCPNAEWVLNGDTLDGLEWLDERPKPTDQEIEAEINRLKPIMAYRASRQKAYPAIEEQLDMIYHDIENWKTTIADIKERFPKP